MKKWCYVWKEELLKLQRGYVAGICIERSRPRSLAAYLFRERWVTYSGGFACKLTALGCKAVFQDPGTTGTDVRLANERVPTSGAQIHEGT